jgi:hypothetical protein
MASPLRAPPTTFGATAPTVTDNGFLVVPTHPNKKKPVAGLEEWENYKFRNGDQTQYKDCGTGIICGEVVGVDIDIRERDLAERIEALAEKMLGAAPRRIGAAPKVLRVYRTDKPFEKINECTWVLPGEDPTAEGYRGHKVEVLATGQQFVAFGIHPGTGKPYLWNGAGSPLSVPATELTAITEAQAREFVKAADAILGKVGTPKPSKGSLDFGADPPPPKLKSQLVASNFNKLLSALKSIPNDTNYDEWVKVGLAYHRGCGKHAKSAEAEKGWMEWCATWPDDDPRKSQKKWTEFFRAKDRPSSVGAATIFALAKQAGWTPKAAKPVRRLARNLKMIDLSTSAKGIAVMNITPTIPLFEGAIYPGAYLLTGRPKIGKSWLELQMAFAAAGGEPFLDFASGGPSDVLYIAAEDNYARLQQRMNQLAGVGVKIPANLRILNQEKFIETAEQCAPNMTLIEWLSRYADKYEGLRLVFIDTETTCRQIWAGERDTEKFNRERATETDYRQTREFDQFALARQIVVVLANHASKRKGEWADIHELINRTGTAMAGVSGSIAMADPPDVSQLDGTSRVKVLGIRGRDLTDDILLSIENAKDDPVFKNRGEWAEVQQTRNEDDLLEAVSELQEDRDTGAYITNNEIAKHLGMRSGTVKRAISRMLESGRTEWRGRGVQTKSGRSGGTRLVQIVGRRGSK